MMKYADLREEVWRANMGLVEAGLVVLTWGNASGVDRDAGVMAIKPSGVDYKQLGPEHIVLLDLESGERIEPGGNPSSDTPTHLALYRAFESIGGVVHTHSRFATSFAQAGVPVPCLGTTHADNFHGEVPVTRPLNENEITGDYEANTGAVIVERFRQSGLNPLEAPGVLVAQHGPFAWGRTAAAALENAIVMDFVASMALNTFSLVPNAQAIPQVLLDKHFFRKHGPGAYYGQQGNVNGPTGDTPAEQKENNP